MYCLHVSLSAHAKFLQLCPLKHIWFVVLACNPTLNQVPQSSSLFLPACNLIHFCLSCSHFTAKKYSLMTVKIIFLFLVKAIPVHSTSNLLDLHPAVSSSVNISHWNHSTSLLENYPNLHSLKDFRCAILTTLDHLYSIKSSIWIAEHNYSSTEAAMYLEVQSKTLSLQRGGGMLLDTFLSIYSQPFEVKDVGSVLLPLKSMAYILYLDLCL